MRITLKQLKQIIKEEIEAETEMLSLADIRVKEPAAFDAYVSSSEDEFWYDEDILMTSDGETDYMFSDGEWQLVEYEE